MGTFCRSPVLYGCWFRRSDGRWRAGHGVWCHFQHIATDIGCSPRCGVSRGTYCRGIHHRHFGYQSCPASQCRLEDVRATAHSRPIGGIAGAYLLSNIDGSVIKPFVLAYLISIGLWLIWRGLMFPPLPRRPKLVEPLGLVGGFVDASERK